MSGRRKKLTLEDGRPPRSGIWLLEVGDKGNRQRLRFSRDMTLVIPWLTTNQKSVDGESKSIDCVCYISGAGGVVIEPSHDFKTIRRSFEARMPARALRASDTGTSWLRLARYVAAAWPIQIGVEESRFSLTLPEEARKLGIAPQGGELAVLFAYDAILEIWRIEQWCEYTRQTTASLEQIKSAAFEELSSLKDGE